MFKHAPIAVAACLFACSGVASATVVIDTVTVGNPGNPGEGSGASYGGYGPDGICGAVDHVYDIGRFEITAEQYTTFLNAVAATDTYDLYAAGMWGTDGQCGIERVGEPGSYTYSVGPNWSQRPVAWVTWGDAARFCNWLHNGQSTGAQGPGTTEAGSYLLNGAMTDAELVTMMREPDATWVLPTEDEWYKAAYHHNDGPSGNYYDYATGADTLPGNDIIDPDPGNNANYFLEHFTLGPPYWRNKVGEFENSQSPYGTFDQTGNVLEWNETVLYGVARGMRGGSYAWYEPDLPANARGAAFPLVEDPMIGFRVAYIPEPATLLMLLSGGFLGARRRRIPGSTPTTDSWEHAADGLLGARRRRPSWKQSHNSPPWQGGAGGGSNSPGFSPLSQPLP